MHFFFNFAYLPIWNILFSYFKTEIRRVISRENINIKENINISANTITMTFLTTIKKKQKK